MFHFKLSNCLKRRARGITAALDCHSRTRCLFSADVLEIVRFSNLHRSKGWHTTEQKCSKHTVASELADWQTEPILIVNRSLLRRDSWRKPGNAWKCMNGKWQSGFWGGLWLLCRWWVWCVKSCHTKRSRSTLTVNFPGVFLNTKSTSLPDQSRGQEA